MFSVVIPNHGRITELCRAVRSALTALRNRGEILVVDDASPNADEIRHAIGQIGDPAVRWFSLPCKGNAAVARNLGVTESKGAWISFLDSDDEFEETKFDVLETALRKHANVNCVFHRSWMCVDGRQSGAVPSRFPVARESLGDFLFVARQLLPTPAITVRRDLALQVPFDPELRRHQDFALILSLEARGVVPLFLDDVLARINWETSTTVLAKGETPELSEAWVEKYQAYLSREAVDGFVSRFVITKALRAGRRRDALVWMRKWRPRLAFVFFVPAGFLFVSNAWLRHIAYRWYKRVQSVWSRLRRQ
jgi:amylovoran biosynthesis glycosyltransferase AmsB